MLTNIEQLLSIMRKINFGLTHEVNLLQVILSVFDVFDPSNMSSVG